MQAEGASGAEVVDIDSGPEDVVSVKDGVPLYLNESGNGTNTYTGVYKLGPNRWQAKLWMAQEKTHRTIGEYPREIDAAYAYAMAKNANNRPANPQPPTIAASAQRVQCKKNARCMRENRHRGICKLMPQRTMPDRAARAAASAVSAARARAAASAAARAAAPAASPANGNDRPARQSVGGPSSAGSNSSAPNRVDASPASASRSTSTGMLMIETLKEIKRQLDSGEITNEEAQTLSKMAREVA